MERLVDYDGARNIGGRRLYTGFDALVYVIVGWEAKKKRTIKGNNSKLTAKTGSQ